MDKQSEDVGTVGPEDSTGPLGSTASASEEALSKMTDLQGTPEAGPVADVSAEPTDEDLEVYGSEAEWLKAKGVEGYDSFDAYKSASEAPFSQLKQIMESYGFKTEAKNLLELNQQLVEELVKGQNAPAAEAAPQGKPETPAPDLTEFFKNYGDQIEDGHKKFYSDLASAVAQNVTSQSQKPLGEVQSRIGVLQDVSELMLARDWYNEAKSSAGDEPVPSFAEARALLQNTPQARDSALFRLVRFGDTTANPMTQMFNVWRAGRVPGGLTKADATKRDTAAKKIAIMKGMLKTTPATRPSNKPRSLEDTAAFLDSLDINNLG